MLNLKGVGNGTLSYVVTQQPGSSISLVSLDNIGLVGGNSLSNNLLAGNATITAGSAVNTGATAGSVTLTAGAATGTSSTAGAIVLSAGAGSGSNNAGKIEFRPGVAASAVHGSSDFYKSYTEEMVTISSAAATTVNCRLGNNFAFTLTANTGLSVQNVPVTGRLYNMTLFITQGATPFSITWPVAVKWPGAIAPTLSSTSGKIDIITLVTYDGGVNWFGFIGGQNY